MCLAEALLRIPDAATRDALIRDKLEPRRLARPCRAEPVAVRQRRHLGPGADRQAGRDQQRAGPLGGADPADRALRRADHPRRRRRRHAADGRAVRHRPDHRGGAANAPRRARRAASRSPTTCWARRRRRPRTPRATTPTTSAPSTPSARRRQGRGIYEGPGISIKLSALHPRYSRMKRARVMAELLPRLKTLAALAQAPITSASTSTPRRPTGSSCRSTFWRRWRSIPDLAALERPRLRRPGLRQALPGGRSTG